MDFSLKIHKHSIFIKEDRQAFVTYHKCFTNNVLSYAMFSSIITLLAAFLSCFVIQVVAVQSQVCYTFVDPCPASWHHWGNSCYRVTHSSFPLSSARDECIKLGGILTVPRSLEENDFIVTLIPDGKNAWIDCDDLHTEGIWECKERLTWRSLTEIGMMVSPDNRDRSGSIVLSYLESHGSHHQWHDELL